MGRVAKKAPETPKAVEEPPAQTITQTRAKRTPKPNPKYANDSVVIPPKIESSESNGSTTDIEEKLPETKIAKAAATKKVINKTEDSLPRGRSKAAAAIKALVKKQKIDFDDDEKTKDADEIPLNSSPTTQLPMRATRSAKPEPVKDEKGEIKVGGESVAIIDVSSIIAKGPTESQKAIRTPARKRQAQEVVEIKDESPKKKKEDDKPAPIAVATKPVLTVAARRSQTASALKKEEEPVKDEEVEVKKEEIVVAEKKEEPTQPATDVKTPTSTTVKTRRSATTPQSAEPVEKKSKLTPDTVVTKTTPAVQPVEPKKLPVMRKEQITKVSPVTSKTAVNNANVDNVAINEPRPAPRLLNSMITPKGAKLSPNVKLAGDGSNKKVFSIDMSDDSLIEKKQQQQQQQKIITTTIATSPTMIKSPAKENVAMNKPQPSMLLKNKLESELSRMKASASLMKRQAMGPGSNARTTTTTAATAEMKFTPTGTRRITKFESWYVIDVKNQETSAPLKYHTHSYSLTRLGNKLKEIQLPSAKWDYKVTLQRRQAKKQQNNNDDEEEMYTGDVQDKTIEGEKHNFEPSTILFKRSQRDINKILIDRSLMIKQNSYTITMNGKQCHLVGAPDDIKSLEDLEILLKIIDACSSTHSCVEITS